MGAQTSCRRREESVKRTERSEKWKELSERIIERDIEETQGNVIGVKVGNESILVVSKGMEEKWNKEGVVMNLRQTAEDTWEMKW